MTDINSENAPDILRIQIQEELKCIRITGNINGLSMLVATIVNAIGHNSSMHEFEDYNLEKRFDVVVVKEGK